MLHTLEWESYTKSLTSLLWKLLLIIPDTDPPTNSCRPSCCVQIAIPEVILRLSTISKLPPINKTLSSVSHARALTLEDSPLEHFNSPPLSNGNHDAVLADVKEECYEATIFRWVLS